jgi:hypothetical protein
MAYQLLARWQHYPPVVSFHSRRVFLHFTAEVFEVYVEKVLAPSLQRGQSL